MDSMWVWREERTTTVHARSEMALATGSGADAEAAVSNAEVSGSAKVVRNNKVGGTVPVTEPNIADTRLIGSEILSELLRRL
jgi:hypothetical protein